MAKSLEDAIAETLKQLRESRGLSQSEVARSLNTKQSVVSRWEKTKAGGGATPSPTTLNNVTTLYGTTPEAVYAATKEQAQAAVPDEIKTRAQELEREINQRQGR